MKVKKAKKMTYALRTTNQRTARLSQFILFLLLSETKET
jgi:hypothetical protein